MRLIALLATSMVGCVASPPEPARTYLHCGDGVCDIDETRLGCPSDCMPGIELSNAPTACGDARGAALDDSAEAILALSESMMRIPRRLADVAWLRFDLENAAFGDASIFPPALHSFDPATGTYRASDGTLFATAHLVRDYEIGAAGATILHDLTELDSFLVGARLPAYPDTRIVYERPGPLVELLEQGTMPPNPIVVSQPSKLLAQHGLDVTVLEDAHLLGVDTHWALTGVTTTGSYHEPFAFTIEAHGKNAALGQDIVLDDNTLSLRGCRGFPMVCSLDGTIRLRASGGVSLVAELEVSSQSVALGCR